MHHVKALLTTVLVTVLLFPSLRGEEVVQFTPPVGWKMADRTSLPLHVQAMVVGPGKSSFPPSINLSIEPYDKSLSEYLKIVRSFNDAKRASSLDLGELETSAGKGRLIQVDDLDQWGKVRYLHLFLKRGENVYILTGAALQEEFPVLNSLFLSSLSSLIFVPNSS